MGIAMTITRLASSKAQASDLRFRARNLIETSSLLC
jgi:hypothetical protein